MFFQISSWAWLRAIALLPLLCLLATKTGTMHRNIPTKQASSNTTQLGLRNGQVQAMIDHPGVVTAIHNFLETHPNDANAETVAVSLAALMNAGKFPEFGPENFIDPALFAEFVLHCAVQKAVHPTWNSWEIYLEAAWRTVSGYVHTALDICGLIPLGGEPCDLTNGVIYTLEGNVVDAALSFSATLPVAGWAATGAKWAGLTVLVGSVVKNLDFKISNGLVDFGDRANLRTILGISNVNHEAHHIIPWNLTNHDLTQRAGLGNFHMNHPNNGMELEKFRINTQAGTHANHPQYNEKVENKMDELWNDLIDYYGSTSQVPVEKARQKLIELQANIESHININPTVKINDLTLNGVNVPPVP